MKFTEYFKAFSPLELSLLILFVLYIIFPLKTPESIASTVDSPLGMIVIFCVTVFLFLYSNPVLGVLYILVAYELIRRSTQVSPRTAMIRYTPSQAKKDDELAVLNPPQTATLEEEVVAQRAPIGKTMNLPYVESDFKPVADKLTVSASLL